MCIRDRLQSISFMSTELGVDVFEKENEEDETAIKFDAKKQFDKDIWNAISNEFGEMIKDCNYPGHPELSLIHISLVHVVFIPDLSWYRKLCKPLLDAHFGLHITDIIFLEHGPLVRSVKGAIPCTLPDVYKRQVGDAPSHHPVE